MSFKKKSWGIRFLMGALTLCIIFGAAFVGVYPVSAASPSGYIYGGEITGVSYMTDEEKPELTGEQLRQEEIPAANTRKWNNSGNEKSMLIIHESAAILHYENGCPYIHDILTNNTDKTIIETEYCMLAYNENGTPLKLYWNFLDSSAGSSYLNLVRSKENILANQTENYRGGWTLYDDELMENVSKDGNVEANQVAYSLICLKQVIFEDGTVWNNPDYENWIEAYAGKEVSVDELENYYPHEYQLKLD